MATPRQEAKVKRVMGEFKAGQLRSSSGDKVTKRKQAVAIALSESGQSKTAGRKAGRRAKARKSESGRRRRS